MICDLCGTIYTTLPNWVLIGPKLIILQNMSYMTTSDAKKYDLRKIGDHVTNAAFDKEPHVMQPTNQKSYEIMVKIYDSISEFQVVGDL